MLYVFRKTDGKPSKPDAFSVAFAAGSKRIDQGQGPFVEQVGDAGKGPDLATLIAKGRLHYHMTHASAGTAIRIYDQTGEIFKVTPQVPVVAFPNPFRNAKVTSEDIDAGMDYCGSGVIFPVAKCRILRPGTPSMTSTFGNDFSAYVPLEGPFAGLPIYTVEHYRVLPGHPAGQVVDVDTPLYEFLGCIEQGWATADGSYSLAWATGYQEGQCSKLGTSFNKLMMALGVASGRPRGGLPATGVLPAAYDKDWEKVL